jgi:Domain of unknown function (DUF4129)
VDNNSGGRAGTLVGIPLPTPQSWLAIIASLLALVAGLYLAASRYLRPRKVGAVWRRTALLSRLGGLPAGAGETPHEFGRRLGQALPEAAPLALQLADNFAVAAYAPPAVAQRTREGVLATWESLRPLLLRRILARLRPASAMGAQS